MTLCWLLHACCNLLSVLVPFLVMCSVLCNCVSDVHECPCTLFTQAEQGISWVSVVLVALQA